MKRFTETQKWEDPWFRKLPPEMKLLWQWILDRCDSAGVIDPDLELASFQIGYQYPMDTLSEFSGRVLALDGGKFFIPKFIEFQYGKLSEDCRAHGPAFQSLKKHGLEGYSKGIHTLQVKVKVTEEEKDTETEAEQPPEPKPKARGTIEEFRAFFSSISLPDSDAEYAFHKWQGNGWVNGKNPIRDWKATVRQWKAGKFFPSQKAPAEKPGSSKSYLSSVNGYNERTDF
jgi:hypothetical protein